MSDVPRLVSLATANPRHVLRQADVCAFAKSIFPDRTSAIDRMLPVYANAGIETRYSCVPLDWYTQDHGWKDRHRLFVENAVELAERAASDAIGNAGLRIDDVDAVVAVSTSGISTPSLDALLIDCMGLRRDVTRLPIFGLGCGGGVVGLARAANLAGAEPGCKVLFVVVELCGLTFRRDDLSKSNIIATALFGDGAAAAVIAIGDDGPALVDSGEYTWPGSLDVMGWQIEDDGFGVLFSRDIPALVHDRLGDALNSYLDGRGRVLADYDGFICHPGGEKVLNALEHVLGLPRGAMHDAREILRSYGNMSAATVLFVLERALKKGISGRHLLSALGPGFTAEFLTLDA
ncbi:MAG: type III polyketide synthase [Alphaproteobacteria bacterium]|nr:type III polyketide synthase [Alphaproteobacteria bacterium]